MLLFNAFNTSNNNKIIFNIKLNSVYETQTDYYQLLHLNGILFIFKIKNA